MLRLREIRKARGLSQEEVARLLGVSQSLISAYEKEERMPPVKKLVKLAKILNVSVEELLDKNSQEGQ